MRVNPIGTIEVLTGSHSHGQGHETSFAQLVSQRFGLPIENISIVHGDTDKVQFGMGTYGSRSGAVGMSAIFKALDKVEAKAKKIAAHLMEASEGDIEIANGEVRVAGTDKKLPWFQVALAAYTAHNLPAGMEPGLKEGAFYDPTNFTFPAGCYICEVEIDPQTGEIDIVQFVAADDFGTPDQPADRRGPGAWRHRPGRRPGAARRAARYDAETGQLVTATYNDYTMPRADDLPSFKVSTTETLCPGNPLGMKGCGEAGAIGSPPAVINAITDALGDNDITMPATPEKLWRKAQKRRPAAGGGIGDATMYQTHYHRPKSLAEAASLFSAGDAAYISGGHTLLPAMKARLAAPGNLIDLRHVPELKGIQVSGDSVSHRRRHDAFRGVEIGRGEERDPDARRACRHDRRRAGAPSRHDRRLGRQQRSGRRLSGRRAGARRHGHHRPPADCRRRVFHRPLHDGAGGGRDRHARLLQGPRNLRLRKIPQPGLALSDGRRLRRKAQGRLDPRGGDGRRQ